MEGDVPNWSEEVCMIKIDQNTLQWTCDIHDLTGKEIVEQFYENKFKKKQKSKRIQNRKRNQKEM